MPQNPTESHSFAGMTILCVDDERIILRTLTRLFHHKQYQVITANDAISALAVMKDTKIDLIVSDMRMPEMDGARLLAQVTKLYPSTYRIILSGYADFDATVDAINLGGIHRFVNKPWDNDELVYAVEEGLNIVRLKQENKKLKNKIEKQNKLLKSANNDLEEKVNLRTKQIRASLLRNDRNNKDCERMLFNFIGINPNLSGAFAKRVALLAVRLGEAFNLDKELIHDLQLSGYLIEVGLLGLDPLYANTPFRLLSYHQKTTFMEQGEIAQQILAPAQRLNVVNSILSHQYLPLNSIIETLKGDHLLACKIIIIARDYWRFASGKIIDTKMSAEDVLVELNKARGSKYDEKILDILIAKPELINDHHQDEGLNSLQILPDMVLKHSLFANNNLLILAEGHVFTDSSIRKLIEYEANQKQKFVIVIEKKTSL